MAPATPPPKIKSLFAALTMASVSISVRSPCSMTILSKSDFIAGVKLLRSRLTFFFCRFLLGIIIDSEACLRRAHQLHYLHLRHRIGHMHSQAAVVRTCLVRKTSNGERRSIARKHCAYLRKLVKIREDFHHHLQLFANSFDDKFRLADRLV